MNQLTRRQVLKAAGATVASWSLAWALPASARQAPLPALSLRRPEPRLVDADLFAVSAPVNVAGTTARMLTYNGSFPGPLLRFREGDRVRLRLTNLLDEPTNLHTHGLHVSPDVDNPVLELPPGETALFEFTIPADSAGTYWYHPHLHGHVAEQLFGGLAGPIVVRGPADYATGLHRAKEYVLVLKDLSLERGSVEPHRPFEWMSGKEGRLLLVNGLLRPRLTPRRSLVRLRLINASNARYYRLALEEHELYLVASDGGLLLEPIAMREILLAPGERVEALVRLEGSGEFRLWNLPYDRGAAMMGHHMGGRPANRPSLPAAAEPEVLLTIASSGPRRSVPWPTRLVDVEQIDPALASRTRRLILSEGMMRHFLINGRSFDERRVDLSARLGDIEIWEIENRGGMDHPFHLHTYPFQVISRDGVAAPFPAWKDVVNVRPREVVRLAVPLRDFGGRTVYHCHIVEHEDQGMMGVLEV